MEFKRNEFVTLEAQTTVHLGRLQKNLRKGDLVEYDGYTLKVAGTTEIMPELRAGVKRGWLTISQGQAPQSVDEALALKNVEAPAKPKKEMALETIYEEERSVSEVAPTNTKKAEAPKKFPVVVESQDDDMKTVSVVENKSGAVVAGASSAELADGGISSAQGAETVGKIKIKTASKQKTIISDGSQASQEINKLDNLDRDDVVVRRADTLVVQDEVEAVLVEANEVDEPELDEVEEPELEVEEPELEVEEPELEVEEPELEVEEPELEIDAEAELKELSQILSAVDGEVAPTQGAVSIGEDNSKIAHLPCGLDWDMNPQWRKRAKIAFEKYSSHPEILDEIMAVEANGVVNAIKKMIEEA